MTNRDLVPLLWVVFVGGIVCGAWLTHSPQPSRTYDLNATCVHCSRGYNIGIEDGFAQGVQATRHDLSMRDLNEPVGCALDALEIEHNEEPIR